MSGCKTGTISWACCAAAGCTAFQCVGKSSTPVSAGQFLPATTKCEESTDFWIKVYTTTAPSLVPIQLHDGQQYGNYKCTGTNCCGGR